MRPLFPHEKCPLTNSWGLEIQERSEQRAGKPHATFGDLSSSYKYSALTFQPREAPAVYKVAFAIVIEAALTVGSVIGVFVCPEWP